MHRYFPHTKADIDAMLQRCGVSSIDDLYSDVPRELRLKRDYALSRQLSEKEVRDYVHRLGDKNRRLVCFAGAGFYNHYSPSVVSSVISRSEFLTAYTPYQPEISQGTLQYIFEYQSMMATLTGMEVSNASLYDGTTATAEAMLMAVAASRKRTRVLVSSTLSPHVRRVVATYASYHGVTVDEVAQTDGVTDIDDLRAKLEQGDVAGVIVASPNYYGILENYSGWAELCHSHKALLIIHCVASDLGLIRTPGEWGADIAVGDGQSLGMPLSYGGPYLGFICTTKALMRKLPGRIVGATEDADGKRVFVLTLQAREQHIRRDKATSNICSNQGLMALYATVYMSVMGAAGLREVCERGCNGAHYLADALTATGKMRLKYPLRPYLNEFLMECDVDVDDLIARCVAQGILPGVKTAPGRLLIAVTEMCSREEMDTLVSIVKSM